MSDDEKYDAFGRPLERREDEAESAPPSGFLPPTEQPPEEREHPPERREQPSGFLPPTDQPPERESWWAEPAPSAPAASGPSAWGAAAPSAPPAPEPEFQGELAPYMERVGAAVLDLLVRLLISAVIGVIVGVAAADAEAGATVGVLVLWLVSPFYAPIMMSRWEGQTVGHRATSTRIVTTEGRPVTGGKAFVREVAAKTLLIEMIGGLFTVGILGLVNYLWPLWDKNNEALHDKMCDTRVVKA